MRLIDMLCGFFWLCFLGKTDIDISGICDDSRKVKKGDVFICITGAWCDGHDYIGEAIDKGAAAIIVSRPDVFYRVYEARHENIRGLTTDGLQKITWIWTQDTRLAEAWMAGRFYHNVALFEKVNWDINRNVNRNEKCCMSKNIEKSTESYIKKQNSCDNRKDDRSGNKKKNKKENRKDNKGIKTILSDSHLEHTDKKDSECQDKLRSLESMVYLKKSEYPYIIGITGTKGKTTTSYMLKSIFEKAGYKVGLIGTVVIDTGKEVIQATQTTPSALELHKYLQMMRHNHVDVVVLEVSSQGLKQHRIAGITLDAAVLTNIYEDHIGPNEHADMEEYMYCKSLIFRQSRIGFVNEDSSGAVQITKQAACPIIYYSLKKLENTKEKISSNTNIVTSTLHKNKKTVLEKAYSELDNFKEKDSKIQNSELKKLEFEDVELQKLKSENLKLKDVDLQKLKPKDLKLEDKKLQNLKAEDTKSQDITLEDIATNMPTEFNEENALAAATVAQHFCISKTFIHQGLMDVHVPGRMEILPYFKDFTVMIDYAHNATALENLLHAVRKIYTGKIICVFGCGGNRDKHRRIEMGEVSGRLADLTIITNDNPRFEPPETIISQIEDGVLKAGGQYMIIPDRCEAIATGISMAHSGDIVIFAGKGHENYQEIKGVKYPLDEHIYIKEKYNYCL